MRLALAAFIAGVSTASMAEENSLSNILNGNGSVGDVTITQTSSISNDQVVSQKKIDGAQLDAYQRSKSGDKSAGQLSFIAGMASDVNKEIGTNNQKNELCKSKAKIGAEVLGYQLDFAFAKCNEFFEIKTE